MRLLKPLGKVLVVLFGLALLACSGLFWTVEMPVTLAVGWFRYLRDVVPQVRPDPAVIAESLLVLAVLAAGLHAFAGWFARERGASWSAGRTAGLLSAVLLMFVVSIASAGVAHQVAWLAQEDLTVPSWPELTHEGRLCTRLARAYDPLEALVADPVSFELDDWSYRVMAWPDGTQVLVWPRGAGASAGGIACTPGGSARTLWPELLRTCLSLPASSVCPAS